MIILFLSFSSAWRPDIFSRNRVTGVARQRGQYDGSQQQRQKDNGGDGDCAAAAALGEEAAATPAAATGNRQQVSSKQATSASAPANGVDGVLVVLSHRKRGTRVARATVMRCNPSMAIGSFSFSLGSFDLHVLSRTVICLSFDIA